MKNILIVEDNEKLRPALKAGLQAIDAVYQLLQAEINIVQAYPLIVRPRGRPAVALMVDNIEQAMETLDAKGFHMVTEGDLSEIE